MSDAEERDQTAPETAESGLSPSAGEPVGPGLTDRRQVLFRLGATGLVGAGFGLGAALTYSSKYPVKRRDIKGKKLPSWVVPVPQETPRVVVARGKDAVANVRAALARLGGMETFIKRGDRVVLKPNAAFDRTPAQAANTSPEVVAEVVRQCLAAGAKEVIVAENTLFDAERCYDSSGIGKAVREAGGRILIPKKSDYTEALVGGVVLDTWPVMDVFFKADKVINLPTVKHHRLARASLGMKNWMGAIGGKRNSFHQKLDKTIADMAAVLLPTLVVLDGSRVLMRHGPTGGSLSDVAPGDTIIAGWDQVAVDRQALPLLGATVTEVTHISEAARRGLGHLRLDSKDLVEIKTGS